MRIDHVIWATRDLDATADRLAARARAARRRRRAPRRDRHHNRVVPLGGGYLEVLAIADAEEAAASVIGRAVAAAPEGLFGWAVAVATTCRPTPSASGSR